MPQLTLCADGVTCRFPPPKLSRRERTRPLWEMLLRVRPELTQEEVVDLSFADLRECNTVQSARQRTHAPSLWFCVDPTGDQLLAVAPCSVDHVRQVNAAEAEFWKNSAGYSIGFSEDVLSFECGGQQVRVDGAPIGYSGVHNRHCCTVGVGGGSADRLLQAQLGRRHGVCCRRLAVHNSQVAQVRV